MNLKSLCLLLFAFATVNVAGQRIIENPSFSGRTTAIQEIIRIELSDTATILHVEGVYRPNWWIMVDSLAYIKPAGSDEKLQLRRAEGIPLNKQFFLPASGRHPYKLIYPPLKPGVSSIDVMDEDGGGVFDVVLTEEKSKEIIPADLMGNWLSLDGSGEWKYTLGKSFAVADGVFWEYAKVKTKGGITEFNLKNGKQKKVIYARKGKNGLALLGENKKDLTEYGRQRVTTPEVIQKSNEAFDTVLLRNGVAILDGFIKGYVPKMGKRKAEVYVNDIFSGKQDISDIEIQEDGRFRIEVELNHPRTIFMRFPFRMDFSVFMEPGKQTMMCLDMEQYYDPWREKEDVKMRPKTSLFMGDNALLNFEAQDCHSFYNPNYRQLQNVVKIVTPQEYKKHISQLKEKALKLLADYEESKGLSPKGKQFLTCSFELGACGEMFEYDYLFRENWLAANKGKKKEEMTPYRRPELGIGYYDFVRALKLGDERPVIVADFKSIINRIKFSDVLRALPNETMVADIIVEMEKSGVQFSAREKEFLSLLSKLQETKGADTTAMNLLTTEYREDNTTFNLKYGQQMTDIQTRNGKANQQIVLDTYFGLKPGFVTEVMELQDRISRMASSFTPLTDEELAVLEKEYTIPFMMEYLTRYNNKLKAKLEENKIKTGYELHKVPVVEKEQLFEAIVEQFKGKAIFVDFWATWCAPCRDGIKKMKSVKEELQGKDIVFIYLTGETSPIKTFENMIPDIKGHHFRLSAKEWSYLCERFKVEGIPHYMLIDKSGKIVQEKYNGWQEATVIKNDLLKLIDRK